MADGSLRNVIDLRKGDLISVDPNDHRIHAKVLSLVETTIEGAGHRRMCELAPGFFLTPTHPLLVNGTRWIRPEWEFACNTPKLFKSLFNIVLEEGPHHTINIQGFAVASWVKYPVGVPMIDRPYKMDTYRVFEQKPGFAEGHVKIDAKTFSDFKSKWMKTTGSISTPEAPTSVSSSPVTISATPLHMEL